MNELSPLALKVYAAFVGDGNTTVRTASLGEPIASYDAHSDRDDQIKEWGLCVGVAYALAANENPFVGLAAGAALAEETAREVWAHLHRDTGTVQLTHEDA